MPPLAPSCVQSSTLTNGELFKGETTFLSGEYIFFNSIHRITFYKKKKKENVFQVLKCISNITTTTATTKSSPTMNLLIFCGGGNEKGSWLIYSCEENVLQRFIFLKKEEKNECKIEA